VDGILGDCILLGPSFIITEKQIEELVEKLDRTLTKVESHIRSND
jgi:adenosylmethionine-8-amino-7-oxononanoate aminotransferase